MLRKLCRQDGQRPRAWRGTSILLARVTIWSSPQHVAVLGPSTHTHTHSEGGEGREREREREMSILLARVTIWSSPQHVAVLGPGT